ncbi:3-oxoacid CoA-transferase subunit B [Rossellomorea vietnamensis]|uniref:3-oxoacid CoA-transferase subunit B n=1 Tax=Rossellomorea vietnamensis TaxID=218284 RepID=A0A5D4KI85_9BACI|nr:3-oxoacid CoA-transferase subunit B [Rossellomorea vietnamensis]TYR76569.1 3-oxoacid CoA-transferase subunit B [Rossellomorea vietnamensis]
MGLGVREKNAMAARAALEISEGMVVNLGIGIPSLVPNHVKEVKNILFHAENGILGIGKSPPVGEEDPNLCNAGGFPVTLERGGSYFDSLTAFSIIRRGLLDLTILGALEVSERGDLANWIIPGKKVPGMGGATELAMKTKKVIVVMAHRDKYGNSKIVKECKLPLTAKGCVNMIITDMGVFETTETGLRLLEIFHPYTLSDITQNTEAPFEAADNLGFI